MYSFWQLISVQSMSHRKTATWRVQTLPTPAACVHSPATISSSSTTRSWRSPSVPTFQATRHAPTGSQRRHRFARVRACACRLIYIEKRKWKKGFRGSDRPSQRSFITLWYRLRVNFAKAILFTLCWRHLLSTVWKWCSCLWQHIGMSPSSTSCCA